MELKEIKPGMAIHCKNDMEYEQLNAEVIKLGYGRLPFKKRNLLGEVNNVLFCFGTDEICWEYVGDFNGAYIEFSDLIIPELSAEEAYNKGMNDAWELAKKIVLNEIDGGMSVKDFYNIFDKTMGDEDVLKKFSPKEVLAKLEAYEKGLEEIKAGDVVQCGGIKGVVGRVMKSELCVICADGSSGYWTKSECENTGKHIDISAILAEIGKE